MEWFAIAYVALSLLWLAFTLGAVVMWAWEGRDRRQHPTWLVAARHGAQVALVVGVFFVLPSPQPADAWYSQSWWRPLGGVLVLGIQALALAGELRHRRRQSSGGAGAA